MKIGVLGTGMVGQTIGNKLIALGHEVLMGSRDAKNEKAAEWVKAAGDRASHGSFADAARFGEILFNCTSGVGAVEALRRAGAENSAGKVVIDISNPLDFTNGFPPTLAVSNTDSLGEQLQREFPQAKIVKTLNTTTANVMVNPSLVPGVHDMFLCGNDAEARALVAVILREWFGWQSIIDLGDITNARGTEQLLPLWVRLYGTFKTPYFNFHIARAVPEFE